MAAASSFGAVFFDLDGTLVDTAPDMVRVLLDLLENEGRAPLDYGLVRSHVSNGAAGLINLGFPDVHAEEHERLRLEYLERYEGAVCVDSGLFPGLADLLDDLDAGELPWGVVTNKPARMTEPLLHGLGLASRAACMISGDTIPQRKPDPAPLLLAAQETGVAPDRSVYVGDAERDIAAGRAAGMHTIGVRYGYVTRDDDPARWNADELVADAEELAHRLRKGVNLGA
jgi:phosphoglycolate phosphatase